MWRCLQASDLFHCRAGGLEYQAGALSLQIEHRQSSDISDESITWATDLTRANMSSFYDATWGWDTAEKLKELGHVRSLRRRQRLPAWDVICACAVLLRWHHAIDGGVRVLRSVATAVDVRNWPHTRSSFRPIAETWTEFFMI